MSSDGQLSISDKLVQFAGLHQDVVLIGIDEHFELWDAARWRELHATKERGRTLRDGGTRVETTAWHGRATVPQVFTRRGNTTQPGVSCAAAPPLVGLLRGVNTKGVVSPFQGWRRCAADPWLCCLTPSG